MHVSVADSAPGLVDLVKDMAQVFSPSVNVSDLRMVQMDEWNGMFVVFKESGRTFILILIYSGLGYHLPFQPGASQTLFPSYFTPLTVFYSSLRRTLFLFLPRRMITSLLGLRSKSAPRTMHGTRSTTPARSPW